MKVDNRYVGYARETAECVDLAYGAMEEDVLTELRRVQDGERLALARILQRLRERRAAINEFAEIGSLR